MIKRFYILLLAIVASVGMMNAKVTWNSSNISDLNVMATFASYSKEGVTLGGNADQIRAEWYDYGDESMNGIEFRADETGGFTFSNTLSKNFTKIEMTLTGPGGWDMANLGSGWSFSWDFMNDKPATVTWTGNASTVDLLKDESNLHGEKVKSIVFYFVGDSEAPDPTYTIALKAGTANADKVTLSATSAIEGATVTVTPDDEYEITAFSAYYVVVEDQLGSIYDIDATLNAETGAYSFTMPAYAVTIEATIAAKPVPEGDIYAGFTATAGAGGFSGEDYSKLVDGKFISSDWTKWCANDGHKSVPTGESESCWWIDFEASAALYPTGYILTTGNDSGSETGRNPKNWVLKAKLNAGDAWTTIATVTNDVTMKNKSFKDYKFFVDQSGSYKYFRFEVFANQGASVMQLCQLRLIYTDAPAPAGLQVTELQVPASWADNPTMLSISDMPGFVAITEAEATAWDAAPAGKVDLIFAFEDNAATALSFKNGVYQAAQAHNITYEDLYAWYSNGDKIFYTSDGSTPDPDPTPTPTPSGDGDKLAGAFSVGGDKVVYFSKANLQATTADNGSTWTWGFAENQWDYVGNSAANNAINGGGTVSTNGPVDLFAWSSTDNNYFGINNSINEADYSGNFKDWGAKMGSDWHTLTINEWQYLLQERNPGSSSANHTNYPRYTNAQILTDGTAPQKDIKGIILFPDDFNDGGESIDGVTWGSINPSFYSSYPTTCTTAGWATLESMGCVFLPSAGSRQNFGDEFAILDVNQMGNYWSSTLYSGEPNDPQSIVVGDGTLGIGTNPRYFGMSVRLVSETAPSSTPTPAGNLKLIEFQVPASWENDNSPITSADFPDFVATTYEIASALPVTSEPSLVVFDFPGDDEVSVYSKMGGQVSKASTGAIKREAFFENTQVHYYYPVLAGGGSTPAGTVTVVFEANNNQKEVEVTLPHTFACDFENGNGELDGIIQELYALQYGGYCQAFTVPTATGNAAVTASKDGNNHYIAISEAFEGTATVTGNYIKYLDTEHMGNTSVDYTLTISVQGSDPAPAPAYTVALEDGTVNADKVTLSATSAVEGATVTVTPNEEYEITAFSAYYVVVEGQLGSIYEIDATLNTETGAYSFTMPAYDVTIEATIAEKAAPAYETVMNLINEIPNPVVLTAECKAKIDAARAAYDALSDGDKAQVTNIATLTTAEAAFDNVMDIWLSGDCDAILWKDTTLTIRKHAGEGNGAMADYTSYYGSNTAPWYNSHWYNPQPGDIVIKSVTIEEGVTHIGENAFGWMSELKTVTIPSSMTSIGEDAFYWSKAVDDIYLTVADPANLTWILPYSADNQFKPEKATLCHVPADLLTAYQENFGTLNMTFVGDLDPITPLTPEQQQALDAVKGLINAIPSPVVYTPACKDAIDAARAAYDALTPDMLKQLVSNYKTLTDAEATYANLKDVAVVEAKIAAIPTPVELKLATRDSIESARAAYDALTADQKLLVSNYQTLLDAEAALAALNPGGGMPADALNGKFTINAGGDQIAFAKGNLQATTEDLGAHWTWGFAANQWNYLGIVVANSKINGNGTVSENGTVDLFGWSTAATYYGINNSYKAVDYIGDFVDWGSNMGAGWRTLTKDEWNYLIENNTKGRATVNDKSGYIFLPNDWSGPAFTPDPDNFTTNVYSGDDWTAMENAGAVFLPSGPARNGAYALIANDAKYSSSTSLNNDTSCVFTIYYNQSQSACTGTNRAYGCMVRLVTEGGGATPLDSAQAVKDLIDAIPVPVTLDDACVNAIEAARAAYDALSEATKGALDEATVKKLTDAEAAYAILIKAEADAVVAKINNIPTPVELKLATRDSINNARAAYDALNAYQKPMVTNYQTLLDAEAALAELNKGGSIPMDIVWDGNTGIANVSPTTTSPAYEGMTVTVGQGSSFSTYQSRLYFTFNSQPNGGFIFANENGTNITKVVIESTSALTSTMTEVDRMGSGWVISNENKTATWTGNTDSVSIWKGEHFANYWVVDMITFTVNGTATPLDSAQAVKDLIDAIPTLVEYPTSGAAIEAALNAFNELSDAAKGALDAADVQKLNDAATQYAALEAIAAIEAIPAEIVYDPAVKAAIETAREKYDALSDASKALVNPEVLQKLIDAEEAWAILAAKVEHNVSYMGKDGELKNEKVALLHIPDPAPEFNGYEFVRWDVKAGDFLEEGLRIKAIYTPIITTNPVAYDSLMYNGMAQTLITAGVAKEGHIEYRINDGEWSAELPQATFAAAYVVYYKLVREGHADYIADPINVTIAKAPVTYTAPTAVENLVYTASNQTLIAAGQTQDGTFEYSLDPTLLDSWKAELPQAKDAGTYSVYYRVQGDLNHLDSTAVDPIAVTIAKAELTATADDKNVIYGDAVPAYTVTYAGWQGDDDVTVLTGDIAFACEYASTSNVGEYTITPSGVSAANYTITFVNGKVTVAQAALMITAEDKNVTYGDAVPTYTATYSGWKNTDGASVISGLIYTCEYAPTSNVGEYTIVPSGATATNYTISYTNGKVTVAQAALMITAEDKNVTYGDAVPEYTATYSGWKNSDDASVVSGLVYTCEYAPTSNVDEYTIVPSGATATNYNISYTNGKVTVAKADLMITADDKNVIYGDAVPTYTATYSGWKNNDDASVVSNLAYTCEYAPTSNVGEYTITPNGATAQNYTISYTNGKVTVAQATLTVTAEDKSVTYGDAAPAFTATYSGWKNTDDASVVSGLTLTSEYLVTSNVGTYDIVPANATALNYTFVYVNGTLTVNKAALMITADDKSVEYGEVAPAFTASYSGWKNTDDASVVSGLTLTSEYLVTSNVGTYDIVPANASAMNYAISYTNGTLTVNQAPLMITADDKSVIYGEVAPAFTASYSGWKNSDDESVVSGLTLTSEYLVTSNVGTYDIVPANASAMNYAISYTNGTLTVNQAALTITAENKEMIYGDEHPEFTVTYAGWKNTDDESMVSGLQFSTPYAPGSYIGTYAINPNSATALNYAITFVDGTLTVNKAHVYVSDAEAQIAKFADGHANAVVLEQGILNGIKLNDPIAHVTTAAFSSADVAEHLTITLFYELTGDAALLNNYNLDPTSDIFTNEGVIIEPFIPDNEEKPEDEEATVNEGIEIYAYGYCDGSGYSLKYHLESGNPDQYKIDFEDSRFTDVDWTNLVITGKDGTIDIEIPVDLPTGDYTMTVYFRDSRFDWLESRQLNVTFHVNLPETYVRPLFDNVIALVDTCECLTDIQWYWRANSSDPWQPIEGANGYYYHVDGKLTGEYFVYAKMNGEPTYTCAQTDMETLYGDQNKQAKVQAYPNPVIDKTIVTIEGSLENVHNLRIVNLMGAEMMNTTFEGNDTSVEMGTYPQGHYMISVDGIVVKVMKK